MLCVLPLLSLAVSEDLQIDPLLLIQAREIGRVIKGKANPVWPGWDAAKTPLLIYLPGKQDVLINHPKPPEGFRPYVGSLPSGIGRVFVKNGPTIFDFDGQNTTTEVNGVATLVVADTLSNRKQSVEGLVASGATAQAVEAGLRPDPYGSMTMFAHEAFHVFQGQRAPKNGGNELALVSYPSLSVDNNVGYALEADALAAALRATQDGDLRKAALQWLAARTFRRAKLSKSSIDYEDGTEFNEGLAKYIEFRLMQAMEGRRPSAEMWLLQGFRGFANLAPERERLIEQMAGFMTGKSLVNNDPYGASSVRFRLYYSGMAIGALLDRLGVEWKSKIFEPETTLSGVAASALQARPDALDAAWKALVDSPRFASLRTEKERLAAEGEAHIQEVLAGFDRAPGELVIDYAKLDQPRVGFAFTPFGILRIDEDRTVFRLLPIRGIANGLRFAEDSARPVLQDKGRKQIRMILTAAPDPAAIGRQLGNGEGRAAKAKLALPGVHLEGLEGRVKVEGRKVLVELTA